jgi:serine phosphatase RsbU (regulator of sigma subunit)
MEISVAVAKVSKYAVSESGDTLEVVERPNGGISIVLADGQTSGKAAKSISNLVVRKVISLLAEGVRDGAAARAASDYLFTERNGKVSATLNILSVDLQSNTLVIARNNPAPVVVRSQGLFHLINDETTVIGTSRNTRPSISELTLEPGLLIACFTDGILHAGDLYGENLNVIDSLQEVADGPDISPESIADYLLKQAVRLDQNRPADDMSIVVLSVSPAEASNIRRMSVFLPVPPYLHR